MSHDEDKEKNRRERKTRGIACRSIQQGAARTAPRERTPRNENTVRIERYARKRRSEELQCGVQVSASARCDQDEAGVKRDVHKSRKASAKSQALFDTVIYQVSARLFSPTRRPRPDRAAEVRHTHKASQQ